MTPAPVKLGITDGVVSEVISGEVHEGDRIAILRQRNAAAARTGATATRNPMMPMGGGRAESAAKDGAAMKNVIDVHDLHKIYDAGEMSVHALKGVSLAIGEGEFVAIMGTSGSGKSTLMNILGCLDRPTSGTYTLDGIDVSELDKDARAEIRNSKIGFVFQG